MTASSIYIPRRSTPTKVLVEFHTPDKSWRVVYAPNGKAYAKLKFDKAEDFAELLRRHARLARAGHNDTPALVWQSMGQVASYEGRVLVNIETTDASVLASYSPEEAEQLAAKVAAYAKICEMEHWREVEKFHTGGVKIHRVWNMPVCNTLQQYERLGDL